MYLEKHGQITKITVPLISLSSFQTVFKSMPEHLRDEVILLKGTKDFFVLFSVAAQFLPKLSGIKIVSCT